MIYKHNFSPHNIPIWNCRYILHNRKSLFLQNWLDKDIWSVMHLIDRTGNILKFEDFYSKFNINDKKQYKKVVNAIPQAIITIASNLDTNIADLKLPSLLIDNKNLLDSKINNITIRLIFNEKLHPLSFCRNSILNSFSKENAAQLRGNFYKFPIPPKVKEIHFKIVNGIYPSADFLFKRFGFESTNCSFCKEHIETTNHIFYECIYTCAFWEDLHHWLSKHMQIPDLRIENIIFGFIIDNSVNNLTINSIVILGKFFVHKNRFLKTKPNFVAFHKELCLFFSSLKHMKKKNAVKLLTLVKELNIMELS
ncbi:uncharacterized protein LOC106511813 [Austrofundulus limnaeus]|uniref:Uncharacterized protein LOC106511813 n=1 Tax=Austrofundulus limnaeus TaxID=52670 RepID=A0A2I4AKL2_AUSLI|nr:PREDICTED: uncharacterized protein LOC106511813 [Austrofundulus limnaeus]